MDHLRVAMSYKNTNKMSFLLVISGVNDFGLASFFFRRKVLPVNKPVIGHHEQLVIGKAHVL